MADNPRNIPSGSGESPLDWHLRLEYTTIEIDAIGLEEFCRMVPQCGICIGDGSGSGSGSGDGSGDPPLASPPLAWLIGFRDHCSTPLFDLCNALECVIANWGVPNNPPPDDATGPCAAFYPDWVAIFQIWELQGRPATYPTGGGGGGVGDEPPTLTVELTEFLVPASTRVVGRRCVDIPECVACP